MAMNDDSGSHGSKWISVVAHEMWRCLREVAGGRYGGHVIARCERGGRSAPVYGGCGPPKLTVGVAGARAELGEVVGERLMHRPHV
jgi:hypothetical protein